MNVEAPKRTLAGVYLLISFVLLGAVYGCEPEQKGIGGAQALRPESTTVQKVHRFHMRCPVDHSSDAQCSLAVLHEDHSDMMDGKPWSREKEACAEKVVHQLLRTMPVGVFDAIASESEEGGLNCTRVLDETPDIRTQAYVAESIPILVLSFNGFHTGMPTKYEGFEWSSETIAIQDGETRYTFYPVTVERLEGDALACVCYPTSPSRIGMYSVLQGSFICSRSLTNVEHFLSHPSKWNPGPPE